LKEKIYTLTTAIQRINSGEVQKDWSDMTELLLSLSDHQDEMQRTQGNGILTGFHGIDSRTGGFFGGNFVIIGARPSVGKSAFMGQMALHQAKQGRRVGIVSLEMNNNEVAARLTSIQTSTDFNTIFRNLYSDENSRAHWYRQVQEMADIPLYISDNTKVSATDIKAKCQKLKATKGIDIVYVD
jgi:replicative DNA helicase